MKPRWLPILLAVASSVPFVQAQIPVTDDAFTSSEAPNANYGTSLGLIVQSPAGAGANLAYTYVKFDLSALPPNVTATNLSKANLRLYVDFVVSPGTFDVYLAGAPWSEGALTASNAPGVVGAPLNQSPISVTRALKYIDIDVTAAFGNGAPSNGLVLAPTKGSNIFVSFDSKENPLTAHDPQLSVAVNDASSAQLQQEVTRATQAENTIGTNLATETTRTTGAENSLNNGLNTETARAQKAEAVLGNNIGNETSRAQSAESALNTGLNNEIANRVAGDTKALNVATGYTDASVANEATLRASADNALQGNITALQNSLGNYAQVNAPNKFAASQIINGDLSVNNVNAAGELTAAGGALLPAVQTATASQGFPSNPFDLAASLSDGNNSHNETFRWQAVPVNNGGANFAAQLSLLYGGGTTPMPTGFSFNADGTQNFASNQIFNGTHSGDGSGLRNVNALTATTANTAAIATSAASAATATNFTGALSGDVAGTQSATVISALAGIPLSKASPKDGQLLSYNAAANQWQPASASQGSGSGPNTPVTPPAPPSPYAGFFGLEIATSPSTTETLELVSFAGCDDKILGVLYDDCYFEIAKFSPALTQWISDTVNATGNTTRNAVVIGRTGSVVSSIQITQGFLRDLRVSDADASDPAHGRISFVVVPASLTTVAGSAAPPPPASSGPPPPEWLNADFLFSIGNVNELGVAKVRGIHMSVPKVPAAPLAARLQFQPGVPQFDDIVVSFVSTHGTDFQNWADNVAQGNIDQRPGTLEVLDQTLKTVLGTVQFFNLSPKSISPFPIGFQRVIDLSVGAFSFE